MSNDWNNPDWSKGYTGQKPFSWSDPTPPSQSQSDDYERGRQQRQREAEEQQRKINETYNKR